MVLIICFPISHSISKYKKGVLLISGLSWEGFFVGFFFLPLSTAAIRVFLALFVRYLIRDTEISSSTWEHAPFSWGSRTSLQRLHGLCREYQQVKQGSAVRRKCLWRYPVMLLSTKKCLLQCHAAVLIVMDCCILILLNKCIDDKCYQVLIINKDRLIYDTF